MGAYTCTYVCLHILHFVVCVAVATASMEQELDKHWLWLENNLLPCLEDFDNPVEAVEFGQAKIKSLIANEQDTKDVLDCECVCEGVRV